MEKIKRTLVSIGIFVVTQIVVTAIFMIAGIAHGMDMSLSLAQTVIDRLVSGWSKLTTVR